jgi:hypothetical protein
VVEEETLIRSRSRSRRELDRKDGKVLVFRNLTVSVEWGEEKKINKVMHY